MEAQPKFKYLLDEHAAPLLTSLGFERRGQVFGLNGPDGWGVVNFQRDRYNTQERVKFTINLGVWSRRLARFHGVAPDRAVFPAEMDCHWRARIGEFLRGGPSLYGERGPHVIDRWWTIEWFTWRRRLGASVCAALRDHGVPQVQCRMSDAALLDLCLNGESTPHAVNPVSVCVLLHEHRGPSACKEYAERELVGAAGKPWESMFRGALNRLGVVVSQ